MSEPIAIDELTTYLACPRQYEYRYRLDIARDPAIQAHERALAAVRDAITAGLVHSGTVEDRIDEALSRLDEAAIDDKAVSVDCREAVRSYLDRYGDSHGTEVYAGDETTTLGLGGREIDCPIDAIVSIDDQPVVLQYRFDVDDVAFDGARNTIAKHTGDNMYIPGPAGSVLRAVATMEALATDDRFATDGTPAGNSPVGFAYVGLTQTVRPSVPTAGDTSEIEIIPEIRRLDAAYEAERDAALSLLDNLITWLSAQAYDPADRFDDIRKTVCGGCSYTGMCSPYINAEVRFE